MSESPTLFPILKTVSETPGCENCPMQKLFPQAKFVPPKIGKALRLVVAEAPGEQEELEGEPLIGSSGKWFDGMCRKAGVSRENLTLVNTINCRPPNNVYPTDANARSYISEADARKAVDHCMAAHVWPLVHGKPWTRIDVLGDKALQEITGEQGILYWRGSPLAVKGETQTRVIPTLHPSYISRDQTMIPIVVNDLKKNTVVPPEFYNITPSIEDLRDFTATDFAFDIETQWGTEQITLVGLCATPFHVIVVPFTGAYVQELKRIFSAAKVVYGQNIISFDLPVLENAGVRLSSDCVTWDTMLLHHLLFPQFSGESGSTDEDAGRKSSGGHGLEFIASQFTNKPAWKEVGRKTEKYWERRNAIDTDVTLQAGRVLVPMARQEQLVDLYNYVQIPIARICQKMHEIGIKIDPTRLAEVRDELLKEIADGELRLPETLRGYDKAKRRKVPAPEGTTNAKGKPVKFLWEPYTERVSPWRSPKNLQKFLYTELALPAQRHPKSKKITTDKGAIEKCLRILRRENRTADVQGLTAYQKVKKAATLISSFCKEDMMVGVSRMYPHFNVHGTSGGRLSSTDPNFQNQPEKARYMYVPDHSDWKFIEVDYSNIEPRLTAYFANDTERLARFSTPGYNDHKYTTSVFFDIPYNEVVKDNDKDAPYGISKRINNGLNYGMGAIKIANTFDMDLKVVKDCIFKWKQLNAQTESWQKETAEKAKADGYLTTPFGRKRWFYTSSYYTESLSFLPQSSAADIIFRAMISLMHERVNWPVENVQKIIQVIHPLPKPARLHLQVHDSLLFGCPGDLVDECVSIIQRVMQQPWPELSNTVIPIDVKVSEKSWAECSPYKPPEVVLPIAA